MGAALLALLLQTGCALLQVPAPDASAAGDKTGVGEPAAPAHMGVRVEVSAHKDLKELLERHLDLVRLGRLAREEVDDSEWSRLIDATPTQVRELLQTEGYFAPQVTLTREPRRIVGEPETVRLTVAQGRRSRIARVTIEVEGELGHGGSTGEPYAVATLAQLRQGWELPVGSEFRNVRWGDAKAAALARLRAAGYAGALWSGTAADIDAESHDVRIYVVADSGPLYRFGGLIVDGLAAQNPETVNNLAATKLGAPITETLLLDFQERLQKSGLFESINVTLDSDPAQAAAARVLVKLREAPLQVYTFGLGFSANIGARASVEHVYRRVFGYAATARNKVEWGTRRQAWDGEVATHPDDDLYRLRLGATVERLESSTDIVLSQRLRLGRSQDTQRIERYYFVEGERSVREVPQLSRNRTLALSVNYHGVWRDLDSLVLPTQGFSFAGQGGLGRSQGDIAASANFGRAYGRLTGYMPLGRSIYAQARVELGQVFIRPGAAVPESQLFRAGGDDSVRGYSFRSLGPQTAGVVSGGKALLSASVELARPISLALPALWGAVFVDAGNAADNFSVLKPAVGAGVGLRWRSPVGPLRLDWAWARETRSARLHFSVGVAF